MHFSQVTNPLFHVIFLILFFLQEIGHMESQLDWEYSLSAIYQLEWRIPCGFLGGHFLSPQCILELKSPVPFVVFQQLFNYPYQVLVGRFY